MRHRHLWESDPSALVCYCGLTGDLEREVALVRADFMREMIDDAELAMLQQKHLPVTVHHIARWGGWRT